MRPPVIPLFLVLGALALGACTRPQTELIVAVDTDLAVPQLLDAVDIDVTGPSMGQPVHAHANLSGTGAAPIPVTLSLEPASTDHLTPVTIVVTGRHGSTTVLTRTVRTGFVLNQRRIVPITLYRSCTTVTCPADQTCTATHCETPNVDPASLPRFTGPIVSDGGRDACIPRLEICNGLDDDCDGVVDNGFDVQSDANNCGACGHVCMLAHTTMAACMAGTCRPMTCETAFGDCDTNASNGCETPLDTLTDCGACRTVCARANATPTCAGAMCRIGSCMTGFDNCDTTDSNGCEAALDQPNHCGTCSLSCSLPNANPGCAAGACTVATCAPNFGNCDGTDSNGCESPLDTPTHCLACGTSCVYANATPTCTGAGCAMGACDAGFGDCDGMASTGCETNLANTAAHCGTCAHACTGGSACNNGVCDNQRIAELGGGAQHTCARRASGGVLCWGANSDGQLGDGSNTRRLTPVPVMGITDADSLATGDSHTCVHRASGAVQCWGQNTYGQLGNASTTSISSPVTATGVGSASQVTAGFGHSCARLTNGTIRCWGLNLNGQLGDGTMTQRTTSVLVSGISLATQVSAGAAHTCGLLSTGTVQCWGSNARGQLGDGTTTDRPTPVNAGSIGATAIASGDNHTCALLITGQVYCWGDNSYGQLGDGTTTSSMSPAMVTGLGDAVEISAGQSHTCARRMTGDVVCWGLNGGGQLGDGTTTNHSVPTVVGGALSSVGITAGNAHSCSMNISSVVSCWGSDSAGQLGNGAVSAMQSTPVTVMNLP